MVARLAKRLNGDRRRALPVGPLHEELEELALAEARAVLIAPAGRSCARAPTCSTMWRRAGIGPADI